ncbi:double-stranded RNA-binding protein zn72d [Aphelenchoides avenae]|nr:double-stranded RNA-binding protein zn72d [Aphelenchus avenae]
MYGYSQGTGYNPQDFSSDDPYPTSVSSGYPNPSPYASYGLTQPAADYASTGYDQLGTGYGQSNPSYAEPAPNFTPVGGSASRRPGLLDAALTAPAPPPVPWAGPKKFGSPSEQQGSFQRRGQALPPQEQLVYGKMSQKFGGGRAGGGGQWNRAPQASSGPAKPYRQGGVNAGGFQRGAYQRPQPLGYGGPQQPYKQPLMQGAQGYLPRRGTAFQQRFDSPAHQRPLMGQQRQLGGQNRRQAPSKTKVQSHRVTHHCEICDVGVSGQNPFDLHLQGKHHRQMVEARRKAGGEVPPHLDVGSVVTEEAVGEEFVAEVRSTSGEVSFRCSLCECEIPNALSAQSHLVGRRHRLQYKAKVDPTLEVDTNPNALRKMDRAGIVFTDSKPVVPKDTYIGPIYNHPFFAVPALTETGGYRPHNERKMDDRHALHVLRNLQATDKQEQQSKYIYKVVENTANAVNIRLTEKAQEEQYKMDTIGEPKAEPVREIIGVVRVGPYSKGIAMATDTEIEAVMMCTKVPTQRMLKDVVEFFRQESDARKVEVEEDPEQSSFLVSVNGMELKCRVTLTSPALREGEGAAAGEASATAPVIAKPADALPVEPSFKALSEVRHSKWFQAKYAAIENNGPSVLRLLCEARNRLPKWSSMTSWALEVLVEKALASVGHSIGPSASLQRVVQVLASGILLSKDFKLLDPCEVEPVDVFASVAPQDREDITASAQRAVRLIAFNQIHTVLGMSEPLPEMAPVPRKRAHNGDASQSDDDVEAKKEKVDGGDDATDDEKDVITIDEEASVEAEQETKDVGEASAAPEKDDSEISKAPVEEQKDVDEIVEAEKEPVAS